MRLYLLGMLNGWEILLIVAAFFLLFGARKLPALAKALAQSIKEFKAGFRDPRTEGYGSLRKGTEGYGRLRKPAEGYGSLQKAPAHVPSGSENA